MGINAWFMAGERLFFIRIDFDKSKSYGMLKWTEVVEIIVLESIIVFRVEYFF